MIRHAVIAVAVTCGLADADRRDELVAAARAAWPRELVRHEANTDGGAAAHVDAALAAETEDLPAELLLAIAYVESRFQPDSTSRNVAGGRRIASRWPSRHAGRGFRPNYFCGALQAKARTWARCLELRQVEVGYAAGTAEIMRWLARAKTVRRALAGHGCGNAGLRTGCRRYASRVYAQKRKLAAALARVELAATSGGRTIDDDDDDPTEQDPTAGASR